MPPRWEIAVAMFDSANPKGAKVYDIVLARPFTGVYGVKERRQYLWIPVDDIDNALAEQITDHVIENGDIKKKNRYRLEKSEIDRLGVVFDEARAKNLNDDYQPFENRPPLQIVSRLTDTEAKQ